MGAWKILKQVKMWDYRPKQDVGWYWRKLCKVKEVFKWRSSPNMKWHWEGTHDGQYRVKEGYKWYLNLNDKVKWVKLTWNSINVPKHCFIAWVLMKNRIPVRSRLARFSDITPQCQICQQEEETQDHLFFHCSKIREMWGEIWH